MHNQINSTCGAVYSKKTAEVQSISTQQIGDNLGSIQDSSSNGNAKLPAEQVAITSMATTKHRLYSLDELLSRAPVSWLLENKELPANAFAVLYGASGSGKSFQALEYALTIGQRDPVVYVAAEGSTGLVDRLIANINYTKRHANNIRVVDNTVQLLNSAEVHSFIASVKPFAPKLIVIDTLARCMMGGDAFASAAIGIQLVVHPRLQESLQE